MPRNMNMSTRMHTCTRSTEGGGVGTVYEQRAVMLEPYCVMFV